MEIENTVFLRCGQEEKQDWHIQLLHNLTYNFNFKLYRGLLHNMDQRTLPSLTHYSSVWPLGTGYTEGSRKTPRAKQIKKKHKAKLMNEGEVRDF